MVRRLVQWAENFSLLQTCHPSGSIKCDKVSVVYCLSTSSSVALTPLFVLFCFVAGGR